MKESNYVIRVIGDLPYYVPLSEDAALTPSLVGAEPFSVYFKHINISRLPGIQHSEWVDDGRGNLIFTKAIIDFPLRSQRPPKDTSPFLEKGLQIINDALLSIKYVSKDYRIRHILEFEQYEILILKQSDSGKMRILCGEKGSYFGPHGLRLAGVLGQEAVTAVWLHFNKLRPLYPSFLLFIDSKYYLDLGDIPNAIFALATSLQIHMETLISTYSKVASSLLDIDIERNNIYYLYDNVLFKATGHSLRERRDLFIQLEYIWQIRNSIAHRWIPQFQVISPFKDKTKYLIDHREKDGHIVSTEEEVEEMRSQAGKIFEFSEDCFFQKYGESSL